jgi:hypothetical protein
MRCVRHIISYKSTRRRYRSKQKLNFQNLVKIETLVVPNAVNRLEIISTIILSYIHAFTRDSP